MPVQTVFPVNHKDDVDKLEKAVKEKLQIGKKDDFAKDVLKALVENAEVAQRSKEYGEIKEAYEKLVKAGMDEEAAEPGSESRSG